MRNNVYDGESFEFEHDGRNFDNPKRGIFCPFWVSVGVFIFSSNAGLRFTRKFCSLPSLAIEFGKSHAILPIACKCLNLNLVFHG